ncbi:D-ribose pyranase [Treponema phagedenis]|uniref:D-ribose pyranase n=1 Tax=Treponema phagedenis TaxID=162 RepID=A0AAE6IWC7_TREPH|nr:D-ribose pyranase [Treponema phagedenis]EFW37939.1 RbsD/FucU transport family protein [Treponema phagedenis F0421]NVP22741.1 D-ribose pyranase [Treponema phagedenis]QEJ98412.1 D-ribose pyranase [Treponema phagedenis]QEK01160.1 D-ribose pyranase [Treponema phagedenis]QEK03920.1 D-ribose pyranase [Treponema phagedenis]
MKKQGILNSDISRVLSYLGHTDRICICDCGLPIPDGVERIDLSVRPGLPDFLTVLRIILKDMYVESYYIAKEIDKSPAILEGIHKLLPDVQECILSHDELKQKTEGCKAVIRTGECSPYANIILQAACRF